MPSRSKKVEDEAQIQETGEDLGRRVGEVQQQAEALAADAAAAAQTGAQEAADAVSETLQGAADAGGEKAGNIGDTLAEAGKELQKQALELLDEGPEHVKQLAAEAQQKARALTEDGLEQFHDVARQASEGFDQATRATGGALRDAAGSIRSHAPESGAAADVAQQLVRGLERSGSYLEEQSAEGIVAWVTDFVRRNPILSALAALGILLLLGRMFRRK